MSRANDEAAAAAASDADLDRMANAESTGRVDNAAVVLFNDYQDIRNEPHLDALTKEYVEGENMKLTLQKLNKYLISTNIRKKNGQDGYLDHNSKVQYASKVKTLLQSKFPDHYFFNNEKAWTDMRNQLKKGAKRFDQNSDEKQSKSRTIALFMDLSKSGNLVRWKALGTNIVDLKTIISR